MPHVFASSEGRVGDVRREIPATFAPGSTLPPSPVEDPALAALTAGNLIDTVNDVEIPIAPGDSFLEISGTVSGLRNTRDMAAELLVVFFVPAAAAAAASPTG